MGFIGLGFRSYYIQGLGLGASRKGLVCTYVCGYKLKGSGFNAVLYNTTRTSGTQKEELQPSKAHSLKGFRV